MKKSKRIVSALILAVGLNLIGCGNEPPALNESGAVEYTEPVEDSTEATESTEFKAEDVETTETKPAEEPTTTPAVPTSTPSPTSTPEPTEPPHVHDYAETVTRQPSCSTEGERVLTCSCGDSKTEAIPATGEHNWEPVYQNVTHPSTGHVEQRETQVQVGTSEMRHEYECKNCGYRTNTPDELADHRASFVGTDRNHATCGTIIYDYPGEPIYETVVESVWVVDTPETTTQELVGYKCSCGATK